MKIRIGSRGSQLAMTQAKWVGDQLKIKNPTVEITFHQITTTGDRDMSASLQAVGGKGVFVKEIEEALLANQIDLAIHSLKDVPQQLPPGLALGPSPVREDPRDVMISRFGELLNELPRNSTVGTSSPRRQAQIKYRYAKRNYQVEPMRGNVDTRLKKLQEGKYDAIILAYAGLKRLGLEGEITQVLEPSQMMPAPCQGCLGLELRANDKDTAALIESIKDDQASLTARAERAFLQGLGGDCYVPVGAFSLVKGSRLNMQAAILNVAGTELINVEQEGPISDSELIGYQLAERLLHAGGSELMA